MYRIILRINLTNLEFVNIRFFSVKISNYNNKDKCECTCSVIAPEQELEFFNLITSIHYYSSDVFLEDLSCTPMMVPYFFHFISSWNNSFLVMSGIASLSTSAISFSKKRKEKKRESGTNIRFVFYCFHKPKKYSPFTQIRLPKW